MPTMELKERTYTPREVTLREREAFASGAGYSFRKGDDYQFIAAQRYPLQKMTRPRVVTEHPCQMGWMVANGQLFYRLLAKAADEPWKDAETTGSHEITIARIAMWADLIANPTEEVEAES